MHSTPVSLLDRLRKPKALGAWDRFVELYSPLLFQWAKRLGLQDPDAADLVQDVFLLLWRQLPEFEYDPSRSFHAWLKTLFLNRARQRLRTQVLTNGDGVLADVPDPAKNLSEEREYRQYLLHQALQLIATEFSPQHVAVFREVVLVDRPVDEVAREFQLSPGSVYCIKSRIVNRLRQELRCFLD